MAVIWDCSDISTQLQHTAIQLQHKASQLQRNAIQIQHGTTHCNICRHTDYIWDMAFIWDLRHGIHMGSETWYSCGIRDMAFIWDLRHGVHMGSEIWHSYRTVAIHPHNCNARPHNCYTLPYNCNTGLNIYHIHIYMYMHIYIHTYIHICTCAYIYIYTCVCIYKYIYNIHIYTYTDMYVCVYLYVSVCAYIYIYIYIYIALQHTATHCNTLQHTAVPAGIKMMCWVVLLKKNDVLNCYGVATMNRLLKTIGLFCRI